MNMKKIDTKKLLGKILVPVLIAATLILIWIVKTHPTSTPIDEQTGIVTDFALEATSIDLDILKEYNLPIIIDFGADSCIPCKEMAPVLKTLNAEMQGKAIIKFVDVWKNGDAAKDFPIQVIPTQVFINDDGTPYVPRDDMEIKFDMYTYSDTGEHAFTVHQGGLTEAEMRAILIDMGVVE
ncbi:thioredoxin C-1 [Anaerotignum neopropionicum]|uniref:Thioredoxin C-1 n=1 Tax=Anaerotignum neopropionicum TaxID=36847 RepID=A0A136WEA2_9FIRM|nr:thioredoxin family protein [Anaerotignum neopropionicum]KXL52845.1 thioredoxin C-1 [Anaerotignum neopropionicum]